MPSLQRQSVDLLRYALLPKVRICRDDTDMRGGKNRSKSRSQGGIRIASRG